MKNFWLDCLYATLFVFVAMWGIYKVTQFDVFNAFDPLGKALGDMEITDITFSTLRLEVPPTDEDIVIVNIGYLSRPQIAQQIRMLSALNPKVIGLDSFFDCPDGRRDSISCPEAYDTLGNLILANAIEEAGNVVLVTKLLQTKKLFEEVGDAERFDSLEYSDPIFMEHAYEGYANLDTDAEHQEDIKTCRAFNPTITMEDGTEQRAFSVQVAMLYDSVKTKKFLDRGKDLEVINFRGNIPDYHGASDPQFGNRYTYLEWNQPFDPSSYLPSIVEGKIVLMGFCGANIEDTSWDDKFITPLNKHFAGKTRPDMYGVAVHANIISMILEGSYINELADWQEFVVAFIICLLNVALFSFINSKIPLWFDGLSVLIQLIQIVLFTFVMMYTMLLFEFKLNLTVTMLAIALVGTCFEIYINVIKIVARKFGSRKWLTKTNDQVLNS